LKIIPHIKPELFKRRIIIMKKFGFLPKRLTLILLLLFCFGLHAENSPLYYNVRDFGVVADDKTKNTQAIKNAIDAATEKGGGTIYFPAGEYLTGPIHLKSNITLFIDAGAILKFSRDFEDYLPMVKSRWEGTVSMNFSPLFYGYHVENVAIRGRGTIDGQGDVWWDMMTKLRDEEKKYGEVRTQTKWQKMHRELNKETITPDTWNWNKSHFLRPPFIQFYESSNILIEGITIKNSPFWTINPAFCDNVTVTGVSIFNPPESYNTDGINPTSCSNVHISNCHISVGDDCITLKSGRDEDGRRMGIPTENITITNCTMLKGHGGVVIGSEMSGDVRKVTISNCVFDGTERGIRIKSMRGRGGIVEEIRVSNIIVKNIQKEAIKLNMFYKPAPEEPLSERTPCFRNIHINNVTGSQTKQAGYLLGLPEMPIENITFNNINIDAEKGFIVKDAKNIEFHNVTVNAGSGPVVEAENVNNLELEAVKTYAPFSDTPVISLKNTENVFIHGANPIPDADVYLNVSGSRTKDVVLSGNNFLYVEKPVIKESDVPTDAVKQ
jgi:polygalacturonase